MLSGWGYRVVAAGIPASPRRSWEELSFDLLFTDVVMPGTISAIELAAMAQRLQPGIAVLLTSGYARDLIPVKDRPDYPLIAKPYRGEELMARLRSVLAARRPSPPPARARPADAAPPPDATGRPRRVLLVEDEVVLRMSTTDARAARLLRVGRAAASRRSSC
jgi:CheY-like chemotaxis protein